jgi:tetratricopeptide (TPR) repeat protein
MSLISAETVNTLFNAIPTSQAQYDSLSNSALTRGIDLYTNNDYAGSVKEFRRAIALSPFSDNAAKAYDYMAQAYLMDDNTDAAIKTYKEAIRAYPTRDTFRISLGDIYYKQGLLPEAEAEYAAAVKLDSESADSRYALGQVYLNSGKYSEAETEFKKVVSLSPSSSTGYYGLGQTYRQTGDFNDAITQLEKAISLDSSFDRGTLELGYTYADMGDMDSANFLADTLSDKGSSLEGDLTDYIYKITTPKFLAAYSTNSFMNYLGPGTTVASLDSTLEESQAEKSFTMRFVFNKGMDQTSIQNPFNWWISRASGTNAGGAYNWGMSIPSTEASIGAIPVSVIYDPESFSADVTFKVAQNATGDATIDPSHIMFRFDGKDAYGKAMDLTADEYSGITQIA